MQKVSAVLIVKNESECLAKCLDSVKDFVTEIIIVDTGSDDNTIEIAKKYTDKVFEDYKWDDNFAEARNHALAKATGDWILSIDADEYLEDGTKIQPAIEEAIKQKQVCVDVKLYAEDTRVMHHFPRLFKRDPTVFWEGAVHNHVSIRGIRVGDVRITYGHSPAHFKDPGRAFRILQKEAEKPNHSPRIDYYLGREYWYRNQYHMVIPIYEKYIHKATYMAEKTDAFLLLSRCYYAIGEWSKARDYCAQALLCNAHFKEALLFMALLAGEGSGNLDWEANAEQWKKMAETADNRNVLFIR